MADEELRHLAHAWMQAWVDRDMATLERILGDDYTLIVSNMPDQPVDRARWLGMLDRYIGESFRYDSIHIRHIGDVAVMSSLFHLRASVDGVDRSGVFFLTDVWQHRDGRWQVVARYSARPEGSTASGEILRQANQ